MCAKIHLTWVSTSRRLYNCHMRRVYSLFSTLSWGTDLAFWIRTLALHICKSDVELDHHSIRFEVPELPFVVMGVSGCSKPLLPESQAANRNLKTVAADACRVISEMLLLLTRSLPSSLFFPIPKHLVQNLSHHINVDAAILPNTLEHLAYTLCYIFLTPQHSCNLI